MNRNMKAITWGMDVRGLEPGPWRVLMVLCGHVGKRDYEVWPSFRTIAEKAEISRDSAKRYVTVLIDRGFIELAGAMWRETGGRSSNRYRICVDEIDVARSDDEEEDDYVAQPDPRGNLHRGQGQGSAPGARCTPAPSREPLEEGTSQLEDSSLPTEEPPSRDLLGDIETVHPRSVDLITYVRAEWDKLCDAYPRIQRPVALNDARQKKIRARARDLVSKSNGALTAHDVWDQVFAAIRASAFLRGEAQPGRGYSEPFTLSIDKILEPARFLQTLERYTIDAERNQHTHSADGRRYGPSEQAMREVIASMGLDRE